MRRFDLRREVYYGRIQKICPDQKKKLDEFEAEILDTLNAPTT
jgi:hypothetical protein